MPNPYSNYFSQIRTLIKKINHLESEFRFCTTVRNYDERLKIEDELGQCYRKLMNCTKKEGLQRVWVEHGLLQFMIVEPEK